MANPEIRIGIIADNTQAVTAIRTTADQGQAAFARMQAAIEAYNKAAARGKAASQALGEAFDKARNAGLGFTEAMEQAVASTEKAAVSTNALAGGSRRATEAMYVLQGSSFGASRAIGDFASKIPGLNRLINEAFSGFVVMAFAEMAYRAGKALYTAFDMGGERARETDQQIRQVTDSLRSMIDSTNVEIDRLDIQNAKLEHRVAPNGAKLAMDEALEAADRMNQKLDSLESKLQTMLTSEKGILSPTWEQTVLTGTVGNRQEQVMLEQHQKWLSQAKTVQDQLNESKSYGNQLEERLLSLKQKQAEVDALKRSASQDAASAAALAIVGTKDYSAEIESVQVLIGAQQGEQTEIQNTIRLQNLQAQNAKDRAAEAAKQTGKSGLGRERAANFSDLLAQQQAYEGKSLGQTVLYWEKVVAETKGHYAELLRAEEQFEKSLNEKGKLRDALEKSARPGAQPKNLRDQIDLSAYYDRNSSAYARYREEVGRGNQILSENSARLELARVAEEEQSGAISRVAADQRRGAIQAKEYADRIAELQARMEALKNALPQATAEGKLPEAEAEIQRLKNEIAQLQGQQQAGAAQNQGRTAEDMAAPYIRATDMVNQAWLGMQNKLIFGQRFLSQAFANMGVSMLESFAASWEKMLVKQAQTEIKMLVQHLVIKQAEVAGNAAAAAESDSIARVSGLKQAFINAKVAAGKVFKHYADVPPVPLVAAAMAAGTFALALSVQAFERGGIIPNTGLALVHEGEGVMPRNLTNLLTSVANNYQQSSSTAVHSTANFSGITDRNFRDMARRHSEVIAESVHGALRGGRVRIAS